MKLRTALELVLLYAVPPVTLGFLHAPRYILFAFLWMAAGACLAWLRYARDLSWSRLWQGQGWAVRGRSAALARFLILMPTLAIVTILYAPERFLAFPTLDPFRWSMVMVVYPILSVLPQTIVFRLFFFERYGQTFSSKTMAIVINALCFGLAHSMYGNLIAPVFSGLAGALLAYSYTQHRSLKWAVLEHALYGDLVFTLGIGWFFFKHG